MSYTQDQSQIQLALQQRIIQELGALRTQAILTNILLVLLLVCVGVPFIMALSTL